MMKKFAFIAAVALLSGAQSPAIAAPAKAAPKAAPKPAADATLSKDQQDHAVQDFGVLASAMQSDKVPGEVKSVLMGCIYSNPLSKISAGIDRVIAANPGKIDRTRPESVLGAMAAICGYKPSEGASAPAPTPSAPQGPTVGR